ncbi:MAG: hypothetical protein KAS66_08180 [Candidatus Omnitrophica bacterium]|nr:hypothetical protein [Candidatus Omnitrophota bacterium]
MSDGIDFEFGGQTLHLSSKVKHKSVKRANNIMTEWMMNNVPLETIVNSSQGVEAPMAELLQTAIMKDPRLAVEIQDLEDSMVIDQTIMLASGLTHPELLSLAEEELEDNYIGLYEKAQELLGGDANDFFAVYRSGSSLKKITRARAGVSEQKRKQTSDHQAPSPE